MRKRDELVKGCIAKAGDEEMCFTLLSRDKAAPVAIRAWIAERLRAGLNAFDDPQIIEARECAVTMEEEQGKFRASLKPAETDKENNNASHQ